MDILKGLTLINNRPIKSIKQKSRKGNNQILNLLAIKPMTRKELISKGMVAATIDNAIAFLYKNELIMKKLHDPVDTRKGVTYTLIKE